jgi:hypothetical protein
MAGLNMQCVSAVKRRRECFVDLSCELRAAYFSGKQTNSADFPCIREEKLFQIYCASGPPALACVQDCAADRNCGKQVDLDKCSIACMDDIVAKQREYGAECYGAAGQWRVCRAFLSCSDRSKLQQGTKSMPCGAQDLAMRTACATK